jgi:hypothetical protein
MKIIDGFIEPILEAAMKKKKALGIEKKAGDAVEEGETLIDHLINSTKGTKTSCIVISH